MEGTNATPSPAFISPLTIDGSSLSKTISGINPEYSQNISVILLKALFDLRLIKASSFASMRFILFLQERG